MKNTIKIMVTSLVLVLTMSLTPVTAEAKAYKAKTVNVTEGKSKTVKTSKKIKKVKICSTNKNFTVKKTANKKFKVSGTDVGKTQTVKVTYTNKNTQKFKIKTKAAKTTTALTGYKKKVVGEVKALLADPDKGLQTALAQWDAKLDVPSNKYQNTFLVNTLDADNKTISTLTIDEVLKQYTASQKKHLSLKYTAVPE